MVSVNTTIYEYKILELKANQTTSMIFEIKGQDNAHVGLFSEVITVPGGKTPREIYKQTSFYEIVIGGWLNKRSVLRKHGQGAHFADVSRPEFLSNTTFRFFWVSWEKSIISLGFGKQVGQQQIFSYDDRTSPLKVNYVGLASLHKFLQYKYFEGKYIS